MIFCWLCDTRKVTLHAVLIPYKKIDSSVAIGLLINPVYPMNKSEGLNHTSSSRQTLYNILLACLLSPTSTSTSSYTQTNSCISISPPINSYLNFPSQNFLFVPLPLHIFNTWILSLSHSFVLRWEWSYQTHTHTHTHTHSTHYNNNKESKREREMSSFFSRDAKTRDSKIWLHLMLWSIKAKKNGFHVLRYPWVSLFSLVFCLHAFTPAEKLYTHTH